MGMSEFYGAADQDEAIATIRRALDLGCTFLDTADMYGPFTNERLVRRALQDEGTKWFWRPNSATNAMRTAASKR